MALSFLEASLLLASAPRLPAGARAVMIGRQTNLLTPEELAFLGQKYGRSLSGLDAASQSWSEPFFQRLGTATIDSLDYSDYEGAAVIHDMNEPWPAAGPPRQFDLVFDGGSLEHVFNVPQALLNAMRIVKPGGLLTSVTPADGWLGHGFHQLQPEFFFRMLSPERGFTMLGCWLGEFGRAPESTRLYRLKDPAMTGMRHIIPGKRPLAMMICARKDAEVSPSSLGWPAQSNYSAAWQAAPPAEAGTAAPPSLKKRIGALLPSAVRQHIQRTLTERRRFREGRAAWQQVTVISPD